MVVVFDVGGTEECSDEVGPGLFYIELEILGGDKTECGLHKGERKIL